MNNRVNVLIPDETFDGNAIRAGFQWLASIAKDDSSIKDCVLFIPTKANLQRTTLTAFLGVKAAKVLDKGRTLRLDDCSIRLETVRSMKGYTQADAAIVVYADQRMMDVVDSNKNLSAVIAIPHHPDAIEQWRRTWNPTTPGAQVNAESLIEDAIVEAALTSLTNRINLANKILNPGDTEATKDAFRILRANGHFEEPANIRAWCIKNGWDPKGADEAMRHAGKAFGLKAKPRSYGEHWAPDIYAQWKSAAK